jgi:hypothetical protein
LQTTGILRSKTAKNLMRAAKGAAATVERGCRWGKNEAITAKTSANRPATFSAARWAIALAVTIQFNHR